MAKQAYSAAELAGEFGTDGRNLRKFLRSEASGVSSVGKGGRYSFELTPAQLSALRKRYEGWGSAQAAPKPEASPKGSTKPEAPAKRATSEAKPVKGNALARSRSERAFRAPAGKASEPSMADELEEIELDG